MEDVKAVADTTYSKFFQVCCGRCCCYYADGDRADRGGVGGRNDDNVGVVHGDGDDGDNDDDDDEDNVHDGVDADVADGAYADTDDDADDDEDDDEEDDDEDDDDCVATVAAVGGALAAVEGVSVLVCEVPELERFGTSPGPQVIASMLCADIYKCLTWAPS